jgi:hypothetical protein
MANPMLSTVQSLAQFDFPEWKQRVRQHATVARIEAYLLPNLAAYDASKDPYVALQPPTIPLASTRSSGGSDPQYAISLYQLQNQEYQIKLNAAQNLLRFIVDTIPAVIRKEVLTAITPAEAYHAILA